MKYLEEKILNTINKYRLIEDGDKIVLGVSGGPDSMCMLNSLINLAKNCPKELLPIAKIVVAHVNHMIREEAKQDEDYVREYCEKNEIEFYAKSIDVRKLANTNKIGTEEAGRLARYDFFNEVLQKTKATKIAIAHNKNDKVETILMHTLRGSGMEGLKGIEPKRGNIIRPLIECERVEIEKYCKENQLNPRIDKTNFENIYNRNKIRNIVIPYIQKEFNPNIVKTIDRLSCIMSLEDEYIEKQTLKAYQELVIRESEKEIVIDLKGFNLQETVIKSRLIRYIIKRLFGSTTSIEKVHIDDVIKLCDNNVGNKYLMPNKNIKVLVKDHKVYIMSQF
jgi:tRNA(Ile)-lysidine synthase